MKRTEEYGMSTNKNLSYLVLIIVIVLFSALGCTEKGPGTIPKETIIAWIEAQNEKDLNAIYELMSTKAIAAYEQLLESIRSMDDEQKESILDRLGIDEEDLHDMTVREFYLTCQNASWKKYAEEHGENFSWQGFIENIKIDGNRAIADVEIRFKAENEKEKILRASLILLRECDVWKIASFGEHVSNEKGAVSTLRIISSAQQLYYLDHGTYSSLATLREEGIIRSAISPGPSNGYFFNVKVIKGGRNGEWHCTARPVIPGVTGTKSFYIDHTDVVRYRECNSDKDPTADHYSSSYSTFRWK